MVTLRLLVLLGLCAPACCQAEDNPRGDGQPCALGFLGSLPLTPSAAHLALDATINGKPARL